MCGCLRQERKNLRGCVVLVHLLRHLQMFAKRLARVRFVFIPLHSLVLSRMSSINQKNENSQSGECATVLKSTEVMPPVTKHQSKEPTRFNDITKSPNDKRIYRGLILHNKMKVLLISDPTTDKSAASLDVKVGFLSDPKELPGLAHFCEHMLFLGTTKYPEINNYNQYLSQNGGASNAATYLDHTNYYFDVNPDKLEGALDRFSQFFISPLFTESVTEKEINAVNSEHEKNLSNDTWRLDQLDKSSADPNHPYCHFGTGSKTTLDIIPKQKNINVRQELLNFHNTWYSANIMALSILGKESLDELEKMVVDMFAEVDNKEIEAPKWPEHPFKEEHFKTKWYAVPIKDIRSLNITFPIPDLQEHYRTGPVHYWAHLLGHEGKGSLLSALKEKGWCDSLVAGQRSSGRGFDFFSIYVDLSEEGILHIDDIITLIYQYINMIKKAGPVEWIFNEYSDIAKMSFRFKEKSPPKNYVNVTVQSLQEFPIEEVLTASWLFTEWKPELINDLKQYFDPEKMRVQIIAQVYEKDVDSVEHWYGTKYKKEKISDELINQWKNAGLNSTFHLPEKNEFIPSKFDIKPKEKVDKFPIIIQDTPFVRAWFKQDDTFLVPKATMTFDFVSPFAYFDPISCNMTNMFVQLFKDSLNEYAYSADLAGLKWELSNSKYGLSLVITGYDHKLDVLLEKILDRMMNFTVDEQRFKILKEKYVRSLKNFEAEQPYQHAAYYLAVLLSEQVWIKSELLNACSLLTVDRVRQFIPLLLSKMHVECLFHGNITKSEALKIVNSKLTSTIKDLTPLQPRQLILHRELQLPNGCHYLYSAENKHHKSSCTQLYYQSGMQSTESNMLLELLTQIISEPCFNTLRNKEQLGYIVFSGIRRANGVQGLRVIVQSDKHPQYVEERINLFMESMQTYITTMPEEEFNRHKESLATKRLEKPKTLSSQSEIYWNEIVIQQYHFDRVNIEVAQLKTITQSQIIDFFKDVVDKDSTQKQKLSVYVISTAEDGAATKEIPASTPSVDAVEKCKDEIVSEPVRILDMLQFKTSHLLYPLVKPFNNVPRKGTQPQQQSKL